MLDRKIAELKATRNALVVLADECASENGDACPMIQAFETNAAVQ